MNARINTFYLNVFLWRLNRLITMIHDILTWNHGGINLN